MILSFDSLSSFKKNQRLNKRKHIAESKSDIDSCLTKDFKSLFLLNRFGHNIVIATQPKHVPVYINVKINTNNSYNSHNHFFFNNFQNVKSFHRNIYN